MNFFSDTTPIVGILNALSTKQHMVSQNIANASTPGYQAKHASFQQLLQGLSQSSPLETKLSQKMGPSPAAQAMLHSQDDGPVQLQRELVDMQQNNLFYSLATRRLSSIITGIRTASGVGR